MRNFSLFPLPLTHPLHRAWSVPCGLDAHIQNDYMTIIELAECGAYFMADLGILTAERLDDGLSQLSCDRVHTAFSYQRLSFDCLPKHRNLVAPFDNKTIPHSTELGAAVMTRFQRLVNDAMPLDDLKIPLDKMGVPSLLAVAMLPRFRMRPALALELDCLLRDRGFHRGMKLYEVFYYAPQIKRKSNRRTV